MSSPGFMMQAEISGTFISTELRQPMQPRKAAPGPRRAKSRSPRPVDAPVNRTVLIVDDDQGTRDTFAAGLSAAGFATSTAAAGSEALRHARLSPCAAAVVDLKLPDMSGIDLVRAMQAEGLTCPFILVSGFLTTQDTVEAMRLGATDVLDKPVDLDDLSAAVNRALESASSAWPASAPPTDVPVADGAERWARLVLRGSQAAHDLKTLEEWARFVGVSYTSLCELCRMLGIRAHDARDLARMLRALTLARQQHCPISVFLDLHDERTLRHLLDRAGLDSSMSASGRSLDDFLTTQRIVDAQHHAIQVLRALLSQRKRSRSHTDKSACGHAEPGGEASASVRAGGVAPAQAKKRRLLTC